MTKVKICGLRHPAHVDAAVQAGASYLGFMFFAKSPRHLEVAEAAALAANVPAGVCKVAVTVDADDAYLDQIVGQVGIDMLQLHGHETPERVAELKARHGLPVMKVVGIAGPDDLAEIERYAQVADQIMVETKAPKDADRPGGNGITFDWALLTGHHWPKPWMLAGGLNPDNIAEAVALTGAAQVDVSSGVEAAPGEKDPDKMLAFVTAANA